MLSSEERQQYDRHLILPEIGMKGQESLKAAKVLVVGAGGLGCPVLQYLTAAGVGKIGIIDGDVVTRSNLQRQILYTIDDINQPKVMIAQSKLQKLNPLVEFEVHNCFLDTDNALTLFQQYDIIVDASDNFPTRYLINDACVIADRPLVFGAIYKFEGQVTVFNYEGGATYRCLFPDPSSNPVPNCSEIGVIGVLPGIIGTLQANEVIKIICGLDGVLSNKFLTFDSLSMQQMIFKYKKTRHAEVNMLEENYQKVCASVI